MGGCISMHMAYHIHRQLAGVFAFSTYLSYDSVIFDSLQDLKSVHLPKLLMIHGDKDELLLYKWGQIAFSELTRLGVHGEFLTLKDVKHEMKTSELLYLEKWIYNVLPPFETDLVHKL